MLLNIILATSGLLFLNGGYSQPYDTLQIQDGSNSYLYILESNYEQMNTYKIIGNFNGVESLFLVENSGTDYNLEIPIERHRLSTLEMILILIIGDMQEQY